MSAAAATMLSVHNTLRLQYFQLFGHTGFAFRDLGVSHLCEPIEQRLDSYSDIRWVVPHWSGNQGSISSYSDENVFSLLTAHGFWTDDTRTFSAASELG